VIDSKDGMSSGERHLHGSCEFAGAAFNVHGIIENVVRYLQCTA
jgi:hypothetical protein